MLNGHVVFNIVEGGKHYVFYDNILVYA